MNPNRNIDAMDGVRSHVLAVTGMAMEARIARGPGVVTISGFDDSAALARAIESAIASGVSAIMSFGIAGALDPALTPGTCIVAREVVADRTRWPVDARWSHAVACSLGAALRADIAGVDHLMTTIDAKRALFAKCGAAAVDMESHIAARIAAAHRLPFAALRVVSDPALRTVPPAAAVGLRADGSIDLPRVLGSFLRNPGQLPLLARTALDTQAALRALRRGRRLLDDGLGFRDFDDLALDVL